MSALVGLAEKTFVISLAHRTDRRASFRDQMTAIGHSDYEVFDAYGVNNQPPARYHKDIPDFEMSGWYGNKFSHYGVIERAKRDGLGSVMVFEDDVVLSPEFNSSVNLAVGQLAGRHWDWLQFGGNHRFFGGVSTTASPIDQMPYTYVTDGLVHIDHNLAEILKMLTAHAYLVKESAYDFILKHAIKSPLSIDGFYAYEIHQRFNCFCVTPCVATQSPGMNDIGNCFSDYRRYIGD